MKPLDGGATFWLHTLLFVKKSISSSIFYTSLWLSLLVNIATIVYQVLKKNRNFSSWKFRGHAAIGDGAVESRGVVQVPDKEAAGLNFNIWKEDWSSKQWSFRELKKKFLFFDMVSLFGSIFFETGLWNWPQGNHELLEIHQQKRPLEPRFLVMDLLLNQGSQTHGPHVDRQMCSCRTRLSTIKWRFLIIFLIVSKKIIVFCVQF